jgi:hypothetical protein
MRAAKPIGKSQSEVVSAKYDPKIIAIRNEIFAALFTR